MVCSKFKVEVYKKTQHAFYYIILGTGLRSSNVNCELALQCKNGDGFKESFRNKYSKVNTPFISLDSPYKEGLQIK